MFNFFAVHVMLDLHSATEMMLQTVNDLQKLFPTSSHLTAAKALTLYHMRSKFLSMRLSTAMLTDVVS